MAIGDYLLTDDLTIVLGLVGAGLFLLHNLYRPQPLVHPILLGRQSDAARVRNPKESALYRNYGTGMLGRFPVRPSKEQQVLLDLVKPDSDASRTLWSTKITNPELRQRVAAFGTGLIRVAGLEKGESNVLLLLNDAIEFLISDLALASHSIASFTLASLSLLASVLESHPPSAIITEAKFVPHLLELIHDSNEGGHHKIIVVGSDQLSAKLLGAVQLYKWNDIESQGAKAAPVELSSPAPQDAFTVSFFSSPSGEVQGTLLTHENLTAGVASTRSLLPLSGVLSPLDTIVSGHSLSTAYGRAVVYTALYEGTNFATLDSTKLFDNEEPTYDLSDLQSFKKYSIPSPTLLFVRPPHLVALSKAILDSAKTSSYLFYSFAWRHKLSGILDGFISKQSLWDRLALDGPRVKVMGEGAGTVRGVVVSGGPLETEATTPARIALSIPIVNAHIHPAVAGPVLASHPLDLQTFPTTPSTSSNAADNFSFTYQAPVGPPTINIEAKLAGVDDASVEAGGDPIGSLLVRGPSVGKLLVDDATEDGEGWVETGERAKVLSNGTFKIAGPLKK